MTRLLAIEASLLLVAVCLSGLAFFVWRSQPTASVNRWFALYACSVVGWTVSIAAVYSGYYPEFSGRLSFVTASLIPPVFLSFSIRYLETQSRRSSTFLKAVFLLGFTFAGLAVLTDSLVYGFSASDGELTRSTGTAYPLFAVYFLVAWGAALPLLAERWRNAKGRARAQLQHLSTGLVVSGSLAITTNLLLPLITGRSDYTWLGPNFGLVLVVLVAHGIIRHRLLDLRLVVRHGLIIALSTVVSVVPVICLLAISWVVLLKQFEASHLTYLFLGIIGTAALAPSIRGATTILLDRYLYRARVSYQQTITEASKAFTKMLELRSLCRFVTNVILASTKCEGVAVFLREEMVLLKVNVGLSDRMASLDLPEVLPDSIHKALIRKQDLIVVDELEHETIDEVREVRGTLMALNCSLILPLSCEGKILGAIAVGPKLSGDPYYPHDLDLLMTLANQAGIAIKNAQLYTEVVLAKEYITNIVATIESGVVAVHSSGRVTMFNRAAEQLTGLAAGDVTGRQLAVLPAVLAGLLRRTLETGRGHTEPEIELQADGALRPVICTTSPLRDPAGAVLGAVAVFSDLTAVKELEAERRRAEQLAYVQLMASSLAHEIKNPLVAVKTFIQLLPRRAGDGRFMEEFSRIVTREIGRMERLLDRLRVLSRPAERPRQPVEVQAPLAEAVEFLQPAFEQKRVALTVQTGSEPRRVLGDHSELEQLFINLLMNALEATPAEGRVEVTVGGSDDQVVVTIADSGPGIPPELLSRVFDPFFTTKPRGSGLGLAISAGIARGHRAKLQASNRAAGGAVFTLEFPVMAPVERSRAEVDADG